MEVRLAPRSFTQPWIGLLLILVVVRRVIFVPGAGRRPGGPAGCTSPPGWCALAAVGGCAWTETGPGRSSWRPRSTGSERHPGPPEHTGPAPTTRRPETRTRPDRRVFALHRVRR